MYFNQYNTTLANVNCRFVDRDMYMRFIGKGVGHCEIHPSPLNESGEDSESTAMELDEGNLEREDGVTPLGGKEREPENGTTNDVAMEEGESDDEDEDSEGSGDEEDDDDDDDDDLGPDDGEEGYDGDDLYAQF
jgi:hypothetical protein